MNDEYCICIYTFIHASAFSFWETRSVPPRPRTLNPVPSHSEILGVPMGNTWQKHVLFGGGGTNDCATRRQHYNINRHRPCCSEQHTPEHCEPGRVLLAKVSNHSAPTASNSWNSRPSARCYKIAAISQSVTQLESACDQSSPRC